MRALFVIPALAALFLAACAGSRPDIDFRSKVQSESTTIKVTPGADGETVGGEISETLTFRDPKQVTSPATD